MPYRSEAQRRWAHTKAGTEALGGPGKVSEWDKASENLKLPARKSKKKLSGQEMLKNAMSKK